MLDPQWPHECLETCDIRYSTLLLLNRAVKRSNEVQEKALIDCATEKDGHLLDMVENEVCLQSYSISRRKVTQVAFVRFFTRVYYQMFPQVACPSRCIVTLVAFMRSFSRVRSQMFFQSTRMSSCKDTSVALVRFLSRVCFQMFPQSTCLD